MSNVTKENKLIFVIMPFIKTPIRNEAQLKSFFEDQLKIPIEQNDFKFSYKVCRSDNAFNITEKIIKDIFSADLVICDLSGIESNPNVMYELGMRLSLTEKPVILIREANPENKNIFDISGFYTHPYDPLKYKELTEHIFEKIRKLENEGEIYESPVLKVLKTDMPLLQRMSKIRALELLGLVRNSILHLRTIFYFSVKKFMDSKKIVFDFGNNVNEMEKSIQSDLEKFKKTDFSEFHFHLSPLPTIEYYLSNQYLNNMDNIIDPKIVVNFTMYLNAHHIYYHCTDVSHYQWRSDSIFDYVRELEILTKMIAVVERVLWTDDKEEKKLLAVEVKELRKQSILIGQQLEYVF